ncbi:MAG: pilus assembly protein PilB [Verrucomicrobia bacterium 61-8]|nr:type II/IV secretion system protein [Verrucomicrobiota bacterium]OJV06362.1 MAG: pilus assembly protein PilB [Verrucomicrobia bacterium 61-8]
MDAKQVTDIFVEAGYLSPETAHSFVQEVATTDRPIETVMIESGLITEAQFYQVIADSLGTEVADLVHFDGASEILHLIPGGLARLHGAMPIGASQNTIYIVLVDPMNAQAVEDLRFALGREIHLMVAPPSKVRAMIDEYYGSEATSLDDVLSQLGDSAELTLREGNEEEFNAQAAAQEANAAPIIRFVDLILDKAIAARASDIHFEPFETEFKIRYRVDGALYEMDPPPRHLALPVISRVKVMSNLNIAERRLPQDGRIQRVVNGKQIDLRVSTLPTAFGESVVLRVLDRSSVNLDLESLGMPEYIYNYILEVIEKPNGIFIVTGPTGSGKTTTLYSCLRKINTIDTKLLTAEDPVEYEIDGIIQVPINDAIGMTFGRILRAFLRQDPDRILVGETRDTETAQIAIQASLTGHLVFTTLHTNDSTGAVTRLMDMGVEPFLISASLECVLAQRLIRRICTSCRTPYEPTEQVLQSLGLSVHDIGDKNFYFGKGCDVCNNTGYKGRKGIYELLKISDPLREMINDRAPGVLMRQKAIELGMTTLREDGLRSIYDGLTTIEEVVKYT